MNSTGDFAPFHRCTPYLRAYGYADGTRHAHQISCTRCRLRALPPRLPPRVFIFFSAHSLSQRWNHWNIVLGAVLRNDTLRISSCAFCSSAVLLELLCVGCFSAHRQRNIDNRSLRAWITICCCCLAFRCLGSQALRKRQVFSASDTPACLVA